MGSSSNSTLGHKTGSSMPLKINPRIGGGLTGFNSGFKPSAARGPSRINSKSNINMNTTKDKEKRSEGHIPS